MKNIHNPIIIKGKAEKRIVWLHNEYVRQQCGISESHNRRNICVGSKTEGVWRCEKINGVWYFDANKIPNREPKYYRNQLPNETELVQMARTPFADDEQSMAAYLKQKVEREVMTKISQEDINYYSYTQKYSRETAVQLAEAKAWMIWISETIENRNYTLYGIENKMDVYKICTEILKERQIKGIKISNISSLRNKIATFSQMVQIGADTREIIIHKGKGNDNANVVNKNIIVNEETGEVYKNSLHLTLIYSLYMNIGAGNKQYKVVLWQEYCQMLLDLGHEKQLSYTTFCRYTNEWEFKAKASMERDGKKVFNDRYMPYVPAEKLKMSHSLWGGDGSSTKLYFNDNGRARALMCYRIADIASREILGYCLYKGGVGQKGETEEVLLNALQMAYEKTGVFGAELITDNGGCAGTNDFRTKMEMLFGKFTTISAGNSQENPTETIIKSMNNFGRRYKNWGGSSFNATQDENKNNPDYLDLKDLPSEAEAIQQAIAWIDAWNHSKRMTGYSPSELCKINPVNPLAQKPNDKNYRYVFGKTTQLDLSYQRGFVNIDFKGAEHKFTIPNLTESMAMLSKATGMKGTIDVVVKWDNECADLYTLEGSYILTCERTLKTHKSYAEEFEGSWKNHDELIGRKVDFIQSASELTENVNEAMNYLNMARTTKGDVKEVYNEQMEEVFNDRIKINESFKEQFKKRVEKVAKIDAVMDLI